jgi:bifunctional ADP-heptose synthase (sugar kinase/adenylyltransferase)
MHTRAKILTPQSALEAARRVTHESRKPMDTRAKILTARSALEAACRVKQEGRKLTVVTGYFDVLLAAHVRDLEVVRMHTGSGCLMVVLLPRAQALLSARARAEIVAGLGMVDFVVTVGDDDLDEFLRRLPADDVISRQAADEEQTRLLMEHVHGRHSL